MLGPRQQQIIAALADGPCSLAALERQAGVERGQLRDALKRLVDQGLVTVTGRRSKRLDGRVVVELSKAVLKLAEGSLLKPKGDTLARFASITGLLRPR
jgi:DNA-binding IclR family transcriptional regulator